MTLHAWRIVKAKHAASAFSGLGAKTFGGRWNSPGTPLVYSAGSVSLAILEMLVHLQSHEILKHYVLFQLTFDDALVTHLNATSLPRTWKRYPAPRALQHLGDAWAAGATSPILRVPSAVVPAESDYLLNPTHPDFPRITIAPKSPLPFDPRLLKPRP